MRHWNLGPNSITSIVRMSPNSVLNLSSAVPNSVPRRNGSLRRLSVYSTQLNHKERLVLAFFLTELGAELGPFVRMLFSQTKRQLTLKLQNARGRETKKYLTRVVE